MYIKNTHTRARNKCMHIMHTHVFYRNIFRVSVNSDSVVLRVIEENLQQTGRRDLPAMSGWPRACRE